MTKKHTDPEIALQVDQLTVNYGKTPVLWDISLEVPSGSLVGIIGPNGAGKSTLLKTVLGLIQPVSGKVSFFGKSLDEMREKVAYVPQRESVDWDFPVTVRDLVVMGRYGLLGLCRRPRKADWAAVDHALNQVGMSGYADRQISQLSGGQQQRIFLARALVQEAEVYLLDEPFVGIDMATESMMMTLLRKLQDEGKTILVVHHDLNTVDSYFNWLIVLNMRLIAAGKVDQVFTPDNLNLSYGKSYALLDEALKLSQQKSTGGKA